MLNVGHLGSCKPCRQGEPQECVLIQKGIIGPPSEWSRASRPEEDISAKEEELEAMFGRVQDSLPYGSVALMRVRPQEYDGEEVVPVVVGRKAPCEWTRRLAVDGMFNPGDIVVWIHDVEQAAGRPREYDLPHVLPDQESRAIPLKSVAGLGQGSDGYLQRVPGTSSSEDTQRYRLRPDAVATARSNVVLMSLNPARAFADFRAAALSPDDESRAFVRKPKFEVGTRFSKGFKAPTRGRNREWNGQKKLFAVVVARSTDGDDRRHYYKVDWSAGAEIRALAHAPLVVDEGYIELALNRR